MDSSLALPLPLEPLSANLLTIGSFDPAAGDFHDVDYTGRTIDGYAVEALIGRGGMADVYRARDCLLRCDVALKILRPRLASPDMCARMVQEAQAAAAIHHPHMLRVLKVGALPGSVYLVMELLRGASFKQFLGDHGGRLPWRDVVAMLLPAMDALHEAHELGLIHRDVKAENLFVTTRARDPRFVIVLDLGIVKADAAFRGPDGPATTPQGHLIGTPTHMAPEQVEDQPVDRRCDVYAMGVTLYHALTGVLPFPPIPGALIKTLQRHVNEVPPALRDVAPDAEIPAALADLVMRALAKSPDGRPPTMRAFADELAAIAAPAPTPPRARRPAIAWGLALALQAALLLAWFAPLAPPAPEPAPTRLILPDTIHRADPPAPQIPYLPQETAHRASHLVADPPPAADPRPTRPSPQTAARRRALDDSPALAACRAKYGRDDPTELPVELVVEASGAVTQARVLTRDVSAVTACIEAALLTTRLPPGPGREALRHHVQGGRP
jgi:serine/threonine protein kinase